MNNKRLYGLLAVAGLALLGISVMLMFSSPSPIPLGISIKPAGLTPSLAWLLYCLIFGSVFLTIGGTGFVSCYYKDSGLIIAALIVTAIISSFGALYTYMSTSGPL